MRWWDRRTAHALIAAWLESEHDRDVLMPVHAGRKCPMFAHAPPARWRWQEYHQLMMSDDSLWAQDVGILLHDLCVIDVDSMDLVTALEGRFPVLQRAPMQRTAKGAHYLFMRSDLADANGYFDGRSQTIPGVDFKTRCSTGTRGLVMCSPSAGKSWVRPPWKHPVFAIPPELLRAVAVATHERLARVTITGLTGGDLVVLDDTWLPRMLFFQGMLEADPGTQELPMPVELAFSREDLARLLALLRGDRSSPPDRATTQQIARLADFVGVPRAWMRLFDFAHPMSWLLSAWDVQDALGEWPVDDQVLPVPDVIPFEPVSEDSRWFAYGVQRERPQRGTNLVGIRLETLPAYVVSLLQRHPCAMLAGGAALSATTPFVGRGSDLDLFLCGCDGAAATRVLYDALATFPAARVAALTANAVTIVTDTRELPVQIILRLYDSELDVFRGFDLPACRVGFRWRDGRLQACTTPSWLLAMRRLAVWVDWRMWCAASVQRICKYWDKGFAVLLPGTRRSALRPHQWPQGQQRSWCRGSRALYTGVATLFLVDAQLRVAPAHTRAAKVAGLCAPMVASAYDIDSHSTPGLAGAGRRWKGAEGVRCELLQAGSPEELAPLLVWRCGRTRPFARSSPRFDLAYDLDMFRCVCR